MASTTTAPPTSWLDVAPGSDFTLSNLPFGVCSFPASGAPSPRCCTRVGAHVIDLSVLAAAGLFNGIDGLGAPARVFGRPALNDFMAQGRSVWTAVRARLVALLVDGGDPTADAALSSNPALRAAAVRPVADAAMHLPAEIGDYTDFYSSREHATNVGTMFRGKDNALQPNWLHLPVGYHGRSSTVVASGAPVTRPCGQLQRDPDPAKGSAYGPCRLLDFELETAFFVGGPDNAIGSRLTIDDAKDRIFGFVLMNDWSARDIQKWEYLPLGPFGAKNFATTISPWVVPIDALEPFVCPTSAVAQTDPVPLPYLRDPNYSSYDIQLEVAIRGEGMAAPARVCASNFANLYWNARQQLVHHAVTGCAMRAGDLLASGTISGGDATAFGSMLELSWKGSREVPLGDTGEVRKFLKDGDCVVISGWAEARGGVGRVGFGTCEGTVLPATPDLEPARAVAAMSVASGRYENVRLYGYWRSSSTWRVRIALAAKGIPYKTISVNLLEGAQAGKDHSLVNPMKQVPVLEYHDATTGETVRLTQSMAIIEFIEEAFADSGASLFPADIKDRAVAREMAEVVNAGTQPLQNLSVMKRIDEGSSGGSASGKSFAKESIANGLSALEKFVVDRRSGLGRACGPFALGTFAPTIADAYTVPQLYNARRFEVDLRSVCPGLLEVEAVALAHPWFRASHPDKQPDAPASKALPSLSKDDVCVVGQ